MENEGNRRDGNKTELKKEGKMKRQEKERG